jgi:hypothetical protein
MMEAIPGSKDKADMVIAVPDSLVEYSSFKPSYEQVELCRDKAKTAEVLGSLAPKTYWLRDTVGAGGKGAQMLTNFLPGKNYSHEFVFYEGEELASFQKMRVSYSVKEKTEGIDNRGTSAVSVCTKNEDVATAAYNALHRVSRATDSLLHGFYGVDLKEDENGVPKVTEINAGRLLTASYNYFYLTEYNLPLIGVQAFLGDPMQKLRDYPEGCGIVWQLGQEAKPIDSSITKTWQ